jgi:class 3 adenylate cyclase
MLGDEFEAMSAVVIQRARNAVHASEGHALRLRVRHTQNRYAEAVDIGVEVAASLGVALPRKPKLPHVLWEVVRVLATQRRRDAMQFADLGEARDPEIRAAVSLLGSCASPAYFAEPNLMPLIGMVCTRLSIKHGMTPQSPYGFAVWALVLCGVLGRIDNGYRFGSLALAVGRRYGGVHEARARFVVDTFVKHWKEPLPEVAQLLHADWAYNRDSGDAESATYCAGVLLYTHFLAGGSLDAQDRYGESIRFLVDCGQAHVKDCFLAWVELFEALRTPQLPAELDGTWFEYTRRLTEFEKAGNGVQIAISSMAAGILDHLAGRFDRAEQRLATAAKWEENIVGQVLVPGLAFFRALNAYRRVAAGLAGKGALKLARRQRARLKRWAVFAPFNLDHRMSLLDAEEAMLRGRSAEAIGILHCAVEQAAGGAMFYQALAQQRLASILEARGANQSAGAAAAQAAQCFMRWGSPPLAAQAEASVAVSRRKTTSTVPSSDLNQLEGADLESLFNAVAAISSEIDESALLGRLMPTLMQAAGADRGLLLLRDAQGRLWVEAEARLGETASRRTPLDGFAAISRRAVDLALRLSTPIVVQDAATDEWLAGETHAKDSGVASMLAMSIALQGRTIGVLYFENHVARSAFIPKRVEVTRALGAQAGIALENARLYGRAQAALEAQTIVADAYQRFVPREFLSGLGITSIVDVQLNEAIELEMNVLFVDLRGFSALSRELGPSRTIAMINRYLSHVQPGIAAYGGFVGQYYGDGLLALFPNDVDGALRGAVAMCRGLEGYNRERGADFPELRFGMGLHRGPVTLGTIGDPDHFQCSVVGDSVNLASRIEGLTKHFGATLVVSSAALACVRSPGQFGLRPLGRVEVAGRAEQLDVFECLACYPESIHDRIAAADATFRHALAAHIAGRWAEALQAFDECVSVCAQDAVARDFAVRCRERVRVGGLWDGVEKPTKG